MSSTTSQAMAANQTGQPSVGSSAPRIRVLVVDDHELIRTGIAALIGRQPDMEVVGEAADGAEAVDLVGSAMPDIVLMDIQMKGMGGLDAIVAIRRSAPGARILVLSTFGGDVQVARAIARGASSYLLKDEVREELAGAVRSVWSTRADDVSLPGAPGTLKEPLTARELDVLARIALGESNDDVAMALRMSANTVKADVRGILRKLNARDRTQALVVALRRGLIEL